MCFFADISGISGNTILNSPSYPTVSYQAFSVLIDVGLNYWPHEDVVVKFDYQTQDAPTDENEYDDFNLGIGYQCSNPAHTFLLTFN